MAQAVTWLAKPEKHDFQAAEDYLSLIMSLKDAATYDLAKVYAGQPLSPILLLRGSDRGPLVVADGYHRVCASYWTDENTDIPCILV